MYIGSMNHSARSSVHMRGSWGSETDPQIFFRKHGGLLERRINSLRIVRLFPQFLYRATIPVLRDAPSHEPTDPTGRWPVLVFSHGLGGSRNAYSHICGSLASYGVFVLAPEHRDGSCPISYVSATKDTPETTVDYKSISHKPSPEVYQARDEQLKIRLWELHLLHIALQKIERGEALTNLAAQTSSSKKHTTPPTSHLEQFAAKIAIKEPGSITWAGHSFGAATTVLFLKSLFYHPSNPHYHNNSLQQSSVKSPLVCFEPSHDLLSQITPSTPTILLDPWALPWNSPDNAELKAKPMPCYSMTADTSDLPSTSTEPNTSPILAILSSAFVNWTSNFEAVKALLKSPYPSTSPQLQSSSKSEAHIFYPLNSAHLSQSDFGVLFPWVTKYLAKAQDPERTMELNVRAIVQVMRENGVKVAPYNRDGKSVSGDSKSTASDGNDDEILSRENGRIQGWVAVSANDAGKVRNVVKNEVEAAEKNSEDVGGIVSGDGMGVDVGAGMTSMSASANAGANANGDREKRGESRI